MNARLPRRLVMLALVAVAIALPVGVAWSHCQVPCGIFDDWAEVQRMQLDTTTIRKSQDEINKLAEKTDPQSVNQKVRWVNNKEAHAGKIMTSIAEYFMAQRIKPVEPGADGYDDYVKKLAEHHAVMVAAMKTKQTADPASSDALAAAIEVIAPYYKPHDHDHAHSH